MLVRENRLNSLIETSKEREFGVSNPKEVKGHITYLCKGSDDEGQWEGTRRYRNFFNLHAVLVARWPGVAIPSIPPKKAFGNKKANFINDRRFYLERFLKKLSNFDFIVNSKEFKLFSRPEKEIEIDKQLDLVHRERSHITVERYM